MGFYLKQIPEERIVKDAFRPDCMTEWHKANIATLRKQIQKLKRERKKIVADFGEMYAKDVDDEISYLDRKISDEKREIMITEATDDLIAQLVRALHVTYMFTVLHEGNTEHNPERDEAVYKFDSGSGALLTIVPYTWSGDKGDMIRLEMNYIFSDGFNPCIWDIEFRTDTDEAKTKTDKDVFKKSAFIKRENYSRYQIAEFQRVIDISSVIINEFLNTYKSSLDRMEEEKFKKMKRSMKNTAELMCGD